MIMRNNLELSASFGNAAVLQKSFLFSELPHSKREVVVRALVTEKRLCSPPDWRKHTNSQSE